MTRQGAWGGGGHERSAWSGVAWDCRHLRWTGTDATRREGRAEERRREPAAALHSLGRALGVERKKRVDCQREKQEEKKKKKADSVKERHTRERIATGKHRTAPAEPQRPPTRASGRGVKREGEKKNEGGDSRRTSQQAAGEPTSQGAGPCPRESGRRTTKRETVQRAASNRLEAHNTATSNGTSSTAVQLSDMVKPQAMVA